MIILQILVTRAYKAETIEAGNPKTCGLVLAENKKKNMRTKEDVKR